MFGLWVRVCHGVPYEGQRSDRAERHVAQRDFLIAKLQNREQSDGNPDDGGGIQEVEQHPKDDSIPVVSRMREIIGSARSGFGQSISRHVRGRSRQKNAPATAADFLYVFMISLPAMCGRSRIRSLRIVAEDGLIL